MINVENDRSLVKEGEEPSAAELEMMGCLRTFGKGLIAAGSSVAMVENTLTQIATVYGMSSVIVALPNILMIKLGHSSQAILDFTVQRLTSLKLDQMSELVQAIDDVQRKVVPPGEAMQQADRILAKQHRFGMPTIVFGYVLSCIGLTLLYRPEPLALLATGATGILVGILVLSFERRPRFDLLLPVIAAFIVSTLMFTLTKTGLIEGSAILIIPPLVTFLPGAVLTTGMIELASKQILSGSARLMYGATTLFFLYIGIAAGLSLSGLPNMYVSATAASTFPWWAPAVGTLLFGIGTFIRLSGANRDLFWMLLVLYVAMLSQTLGERFLSPYFGALLGATMMTLCSELIARSPRRTPALAAQMLAFWFLVPGARGLMGVTNILGADYQSAVVGIGEMLGLMGAISIGVLVGTLTISPQKFGTTSAGHSHPQKSATWAQT